MHVASIVEAAKRSGQQPIHASSRDFFFFIYQVTTATT
jgi:hypothetical protein